MAERAGRVCGRATASAEMAAVPLAALAHLLPSDFVSHEIRPGERVDPVLLFAGQGAPLRGVGLAALY